MQTVEKNNSSKDTVLAMFNSMVGGAMLTFPILYCSAGVITSSIILLLSGLISFVTCRIYVLHTSDEDKDVEWTIRRILGKKW
jgi:amino acid permease